MPLINVSINARSYELACGEGQEAHLRNLADRVNARVTQLIKTNGAIDEARVLVMASILMADELQVERRAHADTQARLANAQKAVDQSLSNDDHGGMEKARAYLADVVDDVSGRLEVLATRLEQSPHQ